jgi:hypothetical protein
MASGDVACTVVLFDTLAGALVAMNLDNLPTATDTYQLIYDEGVAGTAIGTSEGRYSVVKYVRTP